MSLMSCDYQIERFWNTIRPFSKHFTFQKHAGDTAAGGGAWRAGAGAGADWAMGWESIDTSDQHSKPNL